MIPFAQLPENEKAALQEVMAGNVVFRPDQVKKSVTVVLSTDVLDRFTATGEG